MKEKDFGDQMRIVVAGSEVFPETEWRRAVLYFLNTLWSGKKEVEREPEIVFGDLILRRAEMLGGYFFFGQGNMDNRPCICSEKHTLEVEGLELSQVETALARFAKNKKFKQVLFLFDQSVVVLKKGNFGGLQVYTENLLTERVDDFTPMIILQDPAEA
ncbi:hypothetical protein ACFL2D_00700 [Patescibacteria group bacterium]